MKKYVTVSASCIVLVLVGLYLYISPYITLHNIKTSIQQNNSEKLAENVDFPTLRSSVKEEFDSIISMAIAENNKTGDGSNAEKAGAAFGGALVSLFADKFVDLYITPEGLINLLANLNSPKRNDLVENNSSAINPGSIKSADSSADVNYGYTSFNTFTITLNEERNSKLQFVLLRSGLSWKLSRLLIPPDALKKMFNSN
jgi:hypothetical protein